MLALRQWVPKSRKEAAGGCQEPDHRIARGVACQIAPAGWRSLDDVVDSVMVAAGADLVRRQAAIGRQEISDTRQWNGALHGGRDSEAMAGIGSCATPRPDRLIHVNA